MAINMKNICVLIYLYDAHIQGVGGFHIVGFETVRLISYLCFFIMTNLDSRCPIGFIRNKYAGRYVGITWLDSYGNLWSSNNLSRYM